MSETQQDRELERYLQGNDPLSRAYDSLRDEMPSPELDRKVLNEARAAVARARRFPRWQSYAAIAATVVLAFAMVLRIDLDEQLTMEAPAAARAPVTPSSNAVSTDVSSTSSISATLPSQEMAPETAPITPAPIVQGTPVYTVQPDDFGESKRAESQSLQAEQDARRAKAEVGPTKEAAAVGGGTGARLQQPVANMIEERPIPDTTAPAGIQASAPPELRNRIEPSAPAAAGRVQEMAAAAGAEQERELNDDQGTVTGSRISGGHMPALQPLAPEAWLKHIEQLRKDGKQEEADAEMRRFVLTYPDYKAGADAAPTK